jgi:hypothetical protein
MFARFFYNAGLDQNSISKIFFSKIVGGVVRFARVTNSNTTCQIFVLFQVSMLGSFPTIYSTRRINNIISTRLVLTRLYNILKSRENILSDIRECRIRAIGLFARTRITSNTRFLAVIYISKEYKQKKLGRTCNSSC